MLSSGNSSRFVFDCPALKLELRVVGFQVEQGLSSIGWCELELACPQSDLEVRQFLGHSSVLTLFDKNEPAFIHGEIVSASQGKVGKRFTSYHLLLRPKLSELELRAGLRIFQDKNIPDIVKQVLQEAGISGTDVRFELNQAYRPRTYCTQYRESDLAFVSRLLAEEGLYYFFEHRIDRHTLVISDNQTSFKPIAGNKVLPYAPAAGMVTSEESIVEFHMQHQLQSGAVVLRDYFYEKPALKLEQQVQTQPFVALEQYDYPGIFSTAEQGRQRTQTQHYASQVQRQTVSGRCDSQRLACGRVFTLSRHPRQDFNGDYVMTSVRLRGRQPQSLEEGAGEEGSKFSVDFVAIPAGVEYRASQVYPKPRIEGVQTAFVTGPKGEEIYTDQLGRVKVQFHWDREGKYSENSSCWLRLAQSWAGNQWGGFVLPRIGQEVLVTFLNGDPDQPLVTGALYNAQTKPPYDLPSHKTRTTFKSQSTPGGGGFNELRIEDKKASEQLFLHAERDANVFVQSDWKQTVEHDTHRIVQKDAYTLVQEDVHLNVKGNRNIQTGKQLSEIIGADQQVKISGDLLQQAGKEMHVKAGTSVQMEAGITVTLKAGSGTIVMDMSGVAITGKKVRINSGGGGAAAKAATGVTPQSPAKVDPGKAGSAIQKTS